MVGGGQSPKIVLLVRLLAALDEGRSSLDDLKARLGGDAPPSTRTVRRYLATLAEAGFPWFFDRETGTYRFEAGYSLRRIELSADDLMGLSTARDLASSLGGKLAASVDGVTEKLTRVADRESGSAATRPAMRMQVLGPDLAHEQGELFGILQRAQRQRQSVRFAYRDKLGRDTKRHVDPYGFVVSGGRVYMIAHDRARGAKRVFAIDAVSGATIAPQRFTMPDDFDIEAFAASSVSGIMHGDERAEVTIRFAPVVARAAEAERIVRERTIHPLPDGSVEIVYVVNDPIEIVRWSLKWGAEAEVVGPPDVRAAAASIVERLARQYHSAQNNERTVNCFAILPT